MPKNIRDEGDVYSREIAGNARHSQNKSAIES
jgi:hypothetical protein